MNVSSPHIATATTRKEVGCVGNRRKPAYDQDAGKSGEDRPSPCRECLSAVPSPTRTLLAGNQSLERLGHVLCDETLRSKRQS